MERRVSIDRRLARSFGLVTFVSMLILCALLVYEVDIIVERNSPKVGTRDQLLEAAKYVLLPMSVLVLPFYLATRWVISSSLRPLDDLGQRIDAIDGNERGFRIELATLPAEAHPFALAINDLLGRLDRTAEFHETFAAEVAHELKTLLAILSLELGRLANEESRRLLQDVAVMNRLIGQIMLLAQADAQMASPVPRTIVPLDSVATKVALRFRSMAAAAGKTIEVVVEEKAQIRGNRDALIVAVGNLVENALRVTSANGVVKVSVGPGATLSVWDGGPGLSQSQLASLCQRFARGDHPSADGAGLGLSIVSKIAAAHQATLLTDPDQRKITIAF